VLIQIEGREPPGREFCSAGEWLEHVHVAVQVGRDPFEPVPGDTPHPRWTVDARAVETPAGLDLRGPAVHGRRGERFLYLTWGDLPPGGAFAMFRRAKLMVADIDQALLREAAAPDGPGLTATVRLSNDRGHPTCARMQPPDVTWRLTRPRSTPRAGASSR
jgi:hypothetical protein